MQKRRHAGRRVRRAVAGAKRAWFGTAVQNEPTFIGACGGTGVCGWWKRPDSPARQKKVRRNAPPGHVVQAGVSGFVSDPGVFGSGPGGASHPVSITDHRSTNTHLCPKFGVWIPRHASAVPRSRMRQHAVWIPKTPGSETGPDTRPSPAAGVWAFLPSPHACPFPGPPKREPA